MKNHIVRINKDTFDVTKSRHPEATFEEWEEKFVPDDMIRFLFNAVGEYEPDEEVSMCVIVVDDEYFKWLEQNGLENTNKAKDKYMQSVSETQAYRLMQKHNWDTDYVLMGIPVYVNNFDRTYKLPIEVNNELLKYLSKIHGDGNVFLPRYMFKAADCETCAPELLKMGKKYFAGGVAGRKKEWNVQKFTDTDSNVLIIPFVVRRKYDSAVFGIKNIANKFFNHTYFEEEFLTEGGIDNVEDLKYSKAGKMLSEYFGKDVSIISRSMYMQDLWKDMILGMF